LWGRLGSRAVGADHRPAARYPVADRSAQHFTADCGAEHDRIPPERK